MYHVEYDDLGDEVITLIDFDLPPNYREREVELATDNLLAGAERLYLLVSRTVRFEAIQAVRAARPWGEAFAFRDPRRFSSTPKVCQ